MKKALKIIGIILLAIVVAVGIFIGLNWKYVKDLVTGLTSDEEALGKQRLENTETALSDVNSYMDSELRPMTEEEKAAIASGELSQTAVLAQIIADAAGIDLDAMLSGEYTGEEILTPEGGDAAGDEQQPSGNEQSGGEQAPAQSGGSESKPDDGTSAAKPADNSGGSGNTTTTKPTGGSSGNTTTTKPADNSGNSGNTTTTKPNSGNSGSTTTAKPADNSGSSGSTTTAKPGGNSGNSGNTTAAKPSGSSDQLVAGCVSKLYGLQNQYTGQLAGLAARARAYYDQQKSEVGSAAAKSNTIAKFSGEVTSMESSCDAKVESVLGELSSQLKSIGADTSIVGTLRESYNNEKSAQRAIYVNKYLK